MEPFIVISHKREYETWRCGSVDWHFDAKSQIAFFSNEKEAAQYMARLNRSTDQHDREKFKHDIIFASQIPNLVGRESEIENFDMYDEASEWDGTDELRKQILALADAEDTRMVKEREEKQRIALEEARKAEDEKNKRFAEAAKARKEKEERELFERLKEKYEQK